MTFAKRVAAAWNAAPHYRSAPASHLPQVLAVIVFLAVCCHSAPLYAAGPAVNQALPDVTFQTSQDETVRTNDLKGDVVFVYLWATDCKACSAMRAAIDRLNQQFAARGVRFLSINEDADQQTWKEYLVHNPSALIEVWDRNHSFRRKIPSAHLPARMIVDRSGHIRWCSRWTADAEARASAQLASLLQEPPPK